MNSFGAYSASLATVSVPLDLIGPGTCAAIEALTLGVGVATVAVLAVLELLLLPQPVSSARASMAPEISATSLRIAISSLGPFESAPKARGGASVYVRLGGPCANSPLAESPKVREASHGFAQEVVLRLNETIRHFQRRVDDLLLSPVAAVSQRECALHGVHEPAHRVQRRALALLDGAQHVARHARAEPPARGALRRARTRFGTARFAPSGATRARFGAGRRFAAGTSFAARGS